MIKSIKLSKLQIVFFSYGKSNCIVGDVAVEDVTIKDVTKRNVAIGDVTVREVILKNVTIGVVTRMRLSFVKAIMMNAM